MTSGTGSGKFLTKDEQLRECVQLLKGSVMFRYCNDEVLIKVAQNMLHEMHPAGTVLIKQGDPSNRMFLLAEGSVVRLREVDDQVHHIDTNACGTSINSLHLLNQEPTYATAQCTTNVRVYVLKGADFNRLLSDPLVAKQVVYNLCKEIRTQTKLMKTPLLETHPKKVHHPYAIYSVAASIESFYRSALNSLLNTRLTGQKAALFPNMHIQIPTRIIYINGFKGLRLHLDQNVKPEDYTYPKLVRIGIACAPGICLTPVSSLLEASNAGHSNPEPLYIRPFRGLVPRMGREIVFGMGLNQMSDYFEERVSPFISNPVMRNAAGSLIAGVCSGYLSHVPHNLSSMKLMQPHKSYLQHFVSFSQHWQSSVPSSFPKGLQFFTSSFLSIIFPRGVLIRTTQIVGSFIILNGTINALKNI